MSFFVSMDRRRIVTVLVTLGIAFATGHVMQTVLVDPEEVSVLGGEQDAAPRVRTDGTAPALPTPPAATLTPFVPPAPTPRERVPDDPPLTEFEQDDARAPSAAAPCGVAGSVRVVGGGMLRVTLDAPCLAGMPVIVEQDGLRIAWRLDAGGGLAVDVPALSADVTLAAVLPDHAPLTWRVALRAPVPPRVALVWDGPRALFLSHPDADLLGDGSGPMAEIVETALVPQVEARVMPDTCNRIVRAAAMRTDGTAVQVGQVALSLPGCDAVGEILVLQDLFGDRRLAEN